MGIVPVLLAFLEGRFSTTLSNTTQNTPSEPSFEIQRRPSRSQVSLPTPKSSKVAWMTMSFSSKKQQRPTLLCVCFLSLPALTGSPNSGPDAAATGHLRSVQTIHEALKKRPADGRPGNQRARRATDMEPGNQTNASRSLLDSGQRRYGRLGG